MALQSSGAISISQIKAELGSSSNSLRALSAAAGKSTPDAMSEFYGYSNVTCHYWETQNSGDPWGPMETFIYVGCDGYGASFQLSPGESSGPICVRDGNTPPPGSEGDNWYGPFGAC
jgi:hypothetical protein